MANQFYCTTIKPEEINQLKTYEYLKEMDGMWNGFGDMMDRTGMKKKECQSVLKKLEEFGYASHEARYDDECRINGSGWFITPKGKTI